MPQSTERTSLDADRVRAQRVDEFFLHQPDPGCDLRATLEAAHGLAERGLIGRLGLSNFHAAEVGRCVDLCRKHGDLKRSRRAAFMLSAF